MTEPAPDPADELRALEPVFHRAQHGVARAVFERMTASDFWEVGASGRTYSRAEVLAVLAERYADPGYEPMAGLQVSQFVTRQVAADIWLATYHLLQDDRPTRRVSVWRRTADGWQLLYHQGTVVAGDIG